MSDTTISVGLDPNEVIASLRMMADESKKLQKVMEDALANKAAANVDDLKDNVERNTNAMQKYFSNLGERVKGDLKKAFDVSSVLAGANFAKTLADGVKGIFDMERAFDRLNVRLGLTTSQMENFKKTVGRATSEAGVDIRDVNPGLMAAAARGNVKDPAQLTMIASTLAQSKQVNPELDTGVVTENVAEILRRQGQHMNGTNFRQTMDAVNGATVAGGFTNSMQASDLISHMAAYSSLNGMNTRQMAGLAAVAHQSGDAGQGVLMGLLNKGSELGGGQAINAALGQNVFQNGKLNTEALGKVDTSRFGSLSPQIMQEITGITGANGADLKAFVDQFKNGMDAFREVVGGQNETVEQFGKVSQSWAYQTEAFKKRLQNAGQEIGDSFVTIGQKLMAGNGADTKAAVGKLNESIAKNAGDLAIGGALTVGAGLLMGGGIRGLIGGAAADAAGIQKVYVTNANEVSGKDGIAGLLGKFNPMGSDSPAVRAAAGVGQGVLGALGAAALGAAIGVEIGDILLKMFPSLGTKGGDTAYDLTHDDGKMMKNAEDKQMEKSRQSFNSRNHMDLTPDAYAKAVQNGTLAALKEHAASSKPTTFTNPSNVIPSRGTQK